MLKSLQSVCLDIPTPAYVVDERLLRRNLQLLAEVEKATGAKILLAQKCFSMYYFYPLIGEYLSGAAASGSGTGERVESGAAAIIEPETQPSHEQSLDELRFILRRTGCKK